MDKELLDSRVIVTGSPALRFISIIHLLGNDRMYVDLPVNLSYGLHSWQRWKSTMLL
jgi:hypothetical protein